MNRNRGFHGLKRYVITPHVAGILSQILECNVCSRLKDLYLESKLLELIAVYLDEMVCQRKDEPIKLSLSKEDLFALNRVRTAARRQLRRVNKIIVNQS